MKCSAEVRFLVVSVVILMALVMPVAAATFGADAPRDAAAATAADAPSTASATLLIDGAPPPLIFMALGTLLVVLMIGRRVRRAAHEPLRREPVTQS